ncbi:MAG: beta-mannosidase [Chlorobi bacterium]|nr:beta-mannosidase [Chlorobiota bacterium]
MKRIAILLLTLAATHVNAQINVDFTIDAASGHAPISPYIYGINWVHAGEELHADWNLGSRRLGGNRLSNYNWEINASNSGNDCDPGCRNQNDDWLTYQYPADQQGLPGLLPRRFHEDSRTLGAYSLVQLQAAGYVAADRDETVRPVPPAPASRWKEVRFHKNTPFSATPDLNDGYVYTDEEVKYLVGALGGAANGGIQGYSVDNEPGLWYTSHPRLRGLSYQNADEVTQAETSNPNLVKAAKAKCLEVIDKSVAMANAVKGVDPAAEIIGPAFWGFGDYYSLQSAPDWTDYSGMYASYIDMYLDRMRAAQMPDGKRLLDVVDVHWYPQMTETPDAILQSTRSLWDAGYKEDSWIARDVLGAPINLLATLNKSIATYYPGTKLAITEYRYGDANDGDTYYSGIATADALGIFGKYGVYMAQYHPTNLSAPLGGYVAAAFKIFRNYDGAKSAFGPTGVAAATSNPASTSVYASLDDAKPGVIHMIVINKSMTETVNGNFTLNGLGGNAATGDVYAFDNAGAAITHRGTVSLKDGRHFTYTIPPLTVAHIVLVGGSAGVTDGAATDAGIVLSQNGPNPFRDQTSVRFEIPRRGHATLKLYDALGREAGTIADGVFDAGAHDLSVTTAGMPRGSYFCRLQVGNITRTIGLHAE